MLHQLDFTTCCKTLGSIETHTKFSHFRGRVWSWCCYDYGILRLNCSTILRHMFIFYSDMMQVLLFASCGLCPAPWLHPTPNCHPGWLFLCIKLLTFILPTYRLKIKFSWNFLEIDFLIVSYRRDREAFGPWWTNIFPSRSYCWSQVVRSAPIL